MNQSRQDFPFVAGCLLSALVGSGLTLAVIELRRKSSSSHCDELRASNNPIIDLSERSSEHVAEDDSCEVSNTSGVGDGDDDDSISSGEGKDGLHCHGEICQSCNQPILGRRQGLPLSDDGVLPPRRNPGRHSFFGGFNDVDGVKRNSVAFDLSERRSEHVAEENSCEVSNTSGVGDGDDDDSISSGEGKDGLHCHGEMFQSVDQPILRRRQGLPLSDGGVLPPRRNLGRHSFSGGFNDVDGEKRNSIASMASLNSNKSFRYASSGAKVVVLSEEGSEEDVTVMESRIFESKILSKLASLEESKLLLHRMRAVSALASRLMAAPDEDSCFEVASHLLVPLFHIDRCSYVFLKDAEHLIVKGVAVRKKKYAEEMGLERGVYSGVVKPLKGTMVGKSFESRQQLYCPRTKESDFEVQRMLHTEGINTVLATPILVNNHQVVGCIVISMKEEDAFKDYDRILIQDIAAMLGANIYAKRMRKEADNSNRISREMLHTMIPSKVIDKIRVFWEKIPDEVRRRKSSRPSLFRDSISSSSIGGDSIGLDGSDKSRVRRRSSLLAELDFLDQVNSTNGSGNKDAGLIIDTSSIEIGSLARALYAENVKDVVIIFSDIVGFSKIAMETAPLEVVDMLHNIFSRFDALCDKHGVSKLETIGDAYICTTNLFDDDKFGGNVKDAALSALNMAKDMVLATQEVMLPSRIRRSRRRNSVCETLEIRVGIHVGEVTCGVLGQRLPKFTVFGHTVNLAARMEQTCKPNKIRATEVFRSLVAGVVDNWDEYEIIPMKNMGSTGTYIMDPIGKVDFSPECVS